MRCTRDVTARPGRRPGFTLIELLIVIAIIGILSTLAISGVMSLRAAQMKRFTEVTVEKLAHALDQQWKATMDDVKDEAPDLTRFSSVSQVAGGDVRRSRVVYTKMRLKARFPVTFDQALNPDPAMPASTRMVPTEPVFQRELLGVNAGAVPADLQSSILLFLSLSQARRGMAAFSPSDFDATAIATADVPFAGGVVKPMQYFKDSWDNPIRLYTFPTGSDELNGAPYVDPAEVSDPSKRTRLKGRDPQDPEGTLYVDQTLWPDQLRNQFAARVHPLWPNRPPFPLNSPLPVAANLIPVIASAGSDKAWGVADVTMQTTNAGAAGDNIYSYRLRRAGARGD